MVTPDLETRRRYALVFPGQGSQKLGMGRDFRQASEKARSLFQEASDMLRYDLAALCDEGPIERLTRTEFTQPALFVTSCAGLEVLRERCGVLLPLGVAGHSIGEYAALYAGGVFSFPTGLRLVAIRGRLMQQAADTHPGAMMAILGLDIETVEACCAEAQSAGVVVVANDNCLGQAVIAGESAAVDLAANLAKARGARRALKLSVSGGFHSPLMEDVAEALRQELEAAAIVAPAVPVVSNVTADYVRTPEEIRVNLQVQVAGRVRWRESMLRLTGDGMDLCIEVGSGDVLTGLMRRISPNVEAMTVTDMEGVSRAVDVICSRRLAGNRE